MDGAHSLSKSPPKVETKLRLITEFSPDRDWSRAITELSFTISSDRAITVQTRGLQHFLHSQDTSALKLSSFNDRTTRALDPVHNSFSGACFRITDAVTNNVVWDCTAPEAGSTVDPPRLPLVGRATTTLFPGQTVLRRIPLDLCTRNLPGGSYELTLVPRGCWWCEGEVEADLQGRVPESQWVATAPPLVLESEDVIHFRMEKGVVLGEFDMLHESSDES